MQKHKRVLLCICGSIASYKSLELIRILQEKGCSVKVAVSESALEFVRPLSLEVISQQKIISSSFQNSEEGKIDHIQAAQEVDLIVVAPATANIFAKFVHGMGDDLISTILLAASVPILFAPAMNDKMWENPLVQNNIQKAKNLGAIVLETVEGLLACNNYGMGKMLEAADIADVALDELVQKQNLYPKLKGKKVLISLGATREYLDSFRFISNASSGKMGLILASIFKKQKAKIFLVCGHTQVSIPEFLPKICVSSTTEMANEMLKRAFDYDIVIMCAAVSDYKLTKEENKIKKAKFSLELEKTIDILYELGKRKKSQILVGFAAETRNLEAHARDKLKNKNLDLIFANEINESSGFGTDIISYQIISKKKKSKLKIETKIKAAEQLVVAINECL